MKRFSFDVTINKAWTDDQGKMFVRAVASDDQPDAQRDRMTEASLQRMKAQAKQGLPLLETHRSVFGFGKTVDADVRKENGHLVYDVVIELDRRYPQAEVLFDEVKGGKSEKQLSIGGRVNSKNPLAVRFEEVKDGTVRAVDDVILDHIATTRKGMAANPRTKFVSAILKSLDGEEEEEAVEKSVDAGAEIEKKVVPFRKCDALVAGSWDWAKHQQSVIDKGRSMFRDAHAWFDADADPNCLLPLVKSAYKFPHHWLADGVLKTQFPAVYFAMGAVMGGRGGAGLPESEALGVHAHLAQHMRDNGQAPPELTEKVFTGKPWTQEEFSKWMMEHNHISIESFGITKEWWEERWPYWMTKDEFVTQLKKESASAVEAPAKVEKVEKVPAQEDVERGLHFLMNLGRTLGVGGAEVFKKEEVMSKLAAAPPDASATEKEAEKAAEVVKVTAEAEAAAKLKEEEEKAAKAKAEADKKAAEEKLAAEKSQPAPSATPPASVAKKSVGQQVREAVATFVGGGANQTQLVLALRGVLSTEKSVDEDALSTAAEEEISKALLGKKRMAALSAVHMALTQVLADLSGGAESAAAAPKQDPPGAGVTEKTAPQLDSAKLEKDLSDRFGETLQKALEDQNKALGARFEKAVSDRTATLQKSFEDAMGKQGKMLQDVEKAAGAAVSELAGLMERVEAIEKAGGVSQAIPGDDEPAEETRVQKDNGKPWRGMFTKAARQAKS